VPTPQERLDYLQEQVAKYDARFQANGLFLSLDVARCIVDHDDPGLIQKLPAWVAPLVFKICDVVERTGQYGIFSSLGEKDHTVMAMRLAELLKPYRQSTQNANDT